MGKAFRVRRSLREVGGGVQVRYVDGTVELRAFATMAEAERLADSLRELAQRESGIVAVEVLEAEAVRALVQRHGR